MGKNIFQLRSIFYGIAVFALVVGIINSFVFNHALKQHTVAPCVVDIWRLSMMKSLELSSTGDKKGSDVEEVNAYLNRLQEKLEDPRKYGCSFIAVKGSIIGSYVNDITDAVEKDGR